MNSVSTIGLAFNPYNGFYTNEVERYNAKKMEKATQLIKLALENNSYKVILLPIDEFFLSKTLNQKPDLIFNYSTGIIEKNSQAISTGLLEKTGIPFTGSELKTHVIALYKDLSKYVFKTNGIPTPNFQVLDKPNEIKKTLLNYPLFVKPLHEGSSFGVDDRSVVHNIKGLNEKSAEIIRNYRQPALIEEFIPGKEYTVGIWGNYEPELLPILELRFNNKDNINTREVKNKRAMEELCPASIEINIEKAIKKIAIKAYKMLGCLDYARMDFRVDPEGRVYLIEINSLPSLKPDRSSFIKMCRAKNIDFDAAIKRIVDISIQRWGLEKINTRQKKIYELESQ